MEDTCLGNVDQHAQCTKTVPELSTLALYLEKCCFRRFVTGFLVYIVYPEGLKVDSDILTIKGYIVFADVSALQHFLLCMPAFTAD